MKTVAHTPPNTQAGPNFGPVMLDVAGPVLTVDDKARLRHPLTGGVILFARNFVSRTQLIELTSAIRAVRPGMLIAVDHEGGRVQRFRTDGFTHLPALRALGRIWDTPDALRATRAATAAAYVLAAELRACGIDLSFTPVLDLDYGNSGVIGDRALHRDARVVTLLAKSINHGLALAGMANCGKHFPGHGYVAADSHHAIPIDDRTLEAVLADDATPYEWLGPALAAVMPAHVIYPQVDPLPAGFSRFWLQEILRGRFGFDGVIFSDDLSMQGASVAGDVIDAARLALDAGCDMVLICNSPARADQLLDGLAGFARDPASAARVAALRLHGVVLQWDDLQVEARYGHALALLRQEGLVAA